MTLMHFCAATLNVSGGEKTFATTENTTPQSRKKALERLIKSLGADIMCFQEISQYIDADGVTHGLMNMIQNAGEFEHVFYGKTVSMETHMQVKKDVMVNGIFNDWWNWSKGNAIHSRIPFARLGSTNKNGVPRNIPLYQPRAYEGSRDTDPRYALLTRLKQPPFPFVATLHLTTLVGERPPHTLTHKVEESHLMRYRQIQRFLDLVREHVLEKQEPLILMGDFNATRDEFCIAHLLESEYGFVHLTPENDGPTHPKVSKAIDHIFFYPESRLVNVTCQIINSDLSKRASDHLPILAQLDIK